MTTVQFLPDHKNAPADDGCSVLNCALAAGIPLTHACGGEAKCSTCRVLVLEGRDSCNPPNPAESALAQKLGFAHEVRLACQMRPTGPVTVRRLVLDETDTTLATQPLHAGRPDAVGEEKSMAILFSDIRGFTRMSRRLLPYDIVHALNRHFEKMGDLILQYGGTINNVMGDGIMALFEDLPGAAHPALRATRAALEIKTGVEISGKPYFAHAYGEELAIGIGIHYGPVIAGRIGHSESRRLTVIGETVNFASRIESANKATGTTVLVSEDVRCACGTFFAWKEFANISLQGIDHPVTLHEPLAATGAAESV